MQNCRTMQDKTSTVSFDSFSSYRSSGDSEKTGVVKTDSGHLHYVERRVTLGLQNIKENELTSVKKRRTPRRAKSEGNLSKSKILEHACIQGKTPVFGEQRHVIMDMQWQKFGFQLQSYGRMSDRGKQHQTIVQNVTLGSPAFMAGLHNGDAIITVNGDDVRHATPDEVVEKIMETKRSRVHLIVEFIDGVRINELRRKQKEMKKELADKQNALKELLSSKQCLTTYRGASILPAGSDDWTLIGGARDDEQCSNASEESVTPHSPLSPSPSMTDQKTSSRQVAVYTSNILSLTCDALVVPLGNPIHEFNEDDDKKDEWVLTRLLQAGGDKLINELSLAKYCPLGNVITTSGGELKGIKSVFHCVFGTRDQQLITCFSVALDKAAIQKAVSVTFWIDGFLNVGISPSKVLEILLHVNDSCRSFENFGAVILASTMVPEFQSLVADIFDRK